MTPIVQGKLQEAWNACNAGINGGRPVVRGTYY